MTYLGSVFPDLNGEKVMAIRLRSIGDALLMTPALHAIKRKYPACSLSVLVENAAAGIFHHNPDVDDVIVVPGSRQPEIQAFKRRYRYLLSVLDIQRRRFKAVFDFHGGPRSGLLSWLSRAEVRVGHIEYRHTWAYTHKVNTSLPRDSIHSVERQLSLVRGVGIEPAEKNLVLSVDPLVRERLLNQYPELRDTQKPLITFHLWSHTPKKIWPPELVTLVADTLEARFKAQIAFVGGATEVALLKAAALNMRHQPTVLCGEGVGLPEIAAILERTNLYIGNDSGPTHMAAALNCRIIVLFGGSNPQVWHPWTKRYVLLHATQPCAPCRGPTPCRRDFACIRAISCEDVLLAADSLLESHQ